MSILKLLFNNKRKTYNEDCINFNKEYKTCRQCEIISHCIYRCPSDCQRYEKVKKKKRFAILKGTPPLSL